VGRSTVTVMTPPGPTRILIVANRTAATGRLCGAVEARATAGPCRFTLLVPDVKKARDADWTLADGRRALGRAAGAPVAGLAGGPDPFDAVQQAVVTGDYDEIIVSTLAPGASKWLRRDLVGRIRGLGLPVTAITPGDRARRSLDDAAMDAMGAGIVNDALHVADRGSGQDADRYHAG